MPLDWATTQNNLGLRAAEPWRARVRYTASDRSGDRLSAALEECTRERVPLDWARTQNNLGGALADLGDREDDTQHLTEAVAAFRAALEEQTRAQVPLDWAMTQNSLGNALAEPRRARVRHPASYRGSGGLSGGAQGAQTDSGAAPVGGDPEQSWRRTESAWGARVGTQHLTESLTAFRAALEEYTRERMPLYWAGTQNNLGDALAELGTRAHQANELCQALQAHVGAWQVLSGTAPYYASMVVAGTKKDVADIHNQFHGTAPPCLRTYSADLKQMGILN